MRRARGRGRGALGARAARGAAAAASVGGGAAAPGFGGDSSSSSEGEDAPPQKRPRGGRVFLPAPAADSFLQQLKSHNQEDDIVCVKAACADEEKGGSFDAGDPTTTNLFVGNLVRICSSSSVLGGVVRVFDGSVYSVIFSVIPD